MRFRFPSWFLKSLKTINHITDEIKCVQSRLKKKHLLNIANFEKTKSKGDWIKKPLKYSKIFLNKEFKKKDYISMYPDVAKARLPPRLHYIRYGKNEGRFGNLDQILNIGEMPFYDEKETVVLVSHDASRSGAPVLAYNIGKILSEKFNLVIVLLNGGDLESFFGKICYQIIKIKNGENTLHNFTLQYAIKQILIKEKIKFCIANSIQSYSCLQFFSESYIPSILLIHEFFSYMMNSHHKFYESFLWSDAIVFPSKIVKESAYSGMEIKCCDIASVFPQGKCEIPWNIPKDFDGVPQARDYTLEIVENILKSEPFIVLGVGTIEYRKGVDIFIATAAQIKRLKPEYNIIFVWIGKGYDPEMDKSYSGFLFDEINSLELNDRLMILESTPALEDIYKRTDLFFLSSRLDPLPNVAIDASLYGIPLICFEKSSGMVEFLQKDIDTATCIMPYMDVKCCAEKIIDFYLSVDYYNQISNKIKNMSKMHFDMRKYVSRLIDLGSNQECIEKENIDCATIEGSDVFIDNFYLPGVPRQQAIRQFVRSWYRKIPPFRKPFPGFNRELYDFHFRCRQRGVEPFSDYIRMGKPVGVWQEELVQPMDSDNFALDLKKCGIHIHAFYPYLLPLILERLNLNRSKYDLFVSTSEKNVNQVRDILFKFNQTNYKLHVVPNKGRDIGPFITEFGFDLQQYEVIGHIHTKASLCVKNKKVVEEWVYFLVENLLGGQFRMLDSIIDLFKKKPKLGLVFPDDPNLLDWGKNKAFADKLAQELNLPKLPEGRFNFPIGTMFWARSDALKPLLSLDWPWDRYPTEPLAYDGSELHAIERLIPSIVASQGFTQAVTYIPGITR